MEQRLIQFVDILRRSGLTIGIADTHTAMDAVAEVGYEDRQQLRNTLATVLAGDRSEQLLLEDCFDRFFRFLPAEQTPPSEADNGETFEQLANSEQLQELLNASDSELQLAIDAAGNDVATSDIRYFTQKGQFTRRLLEALDWPVLQEAIMQMQEGLDGDMGSSAGGGMGIEAARGLADRMLATARDHVDRQYMLYGQPQTEELKEQRLMTTPIRMLDPSQRRDLHALVIKICRRLHKKYRKRAVITQRGLLDVRSTLRHNMAYEGVPFKPQWRKKHKNRPQVFVIADISGSVAASASLLLGFISALESILPKARSFVFSNCLGEVTGEFDIDKWEESQQAIMKKWGYGSTDYGRTLREFEEDVCGNLRRDSVVIMLGDARNNYGDPALESWRAIADNCRAVYWLNPEGRSLWDTGDSIMQSYSEDCRKVVEAGNLAQLASFCDYLLQHS